MHLIGISLAIQLLCAVHCVRSRGNRAWLFVILGLSIPGCLAYCLFEIFPGLVRNRNVGIAKEIALRKLDPERAVRAARQAIETVDTAANRTRLADALADNGEWKEAISHYERALAKTPGKDRVVETRLACAYLESGNPAQARKILKALPDSFSEGENDRARLLLARSLEKLGETAQALALYEELSPRLPGGEARCRRAALLMKEGRKQEAKEVLEDVERLARHLDRYERIQQAEMYAWAANTLSELRETSVS